jgi:hypothetical protein
MASRVLGFSSPYQGLVLEADVNGAACHDQRFASTDNAGDGGRYSGNKAINLALQQTKQTLLGRSLPALTLFL